MIRRTIELALVELIVFLLLWFWNSFLAFYLTLTLTLICFTILTISGIAEWIERSKVPKFYFYAMATSTIVPWIAAGVIALLGLDISILG